MSLALDQFVDREGETMIPEPYTPGTSMIVDLAGNGKAISGLCGLSVGYKTTKEVCIGIRTSGKVGSGSWDDPFDGSTRAKFDTIAASYAGQSNIILRLRDGGMETYGSHVWAPGTGWRIVGDGPKQTLLKQMYLPTAGGDFGVIVSDAHDVEIHDMTLDCNFPTLYAAASSPVSAAIYGAFARSGIIHNVRAINPGSTGETFVLSLQCYGPVAGSYAARRALAPIRSEISGCRVESPDATHHALTCFAVAAGYYEFTFPPANQDVLPYGALGILKDNVVDVLEGYATIAYQLSGFESCKAQGNYSKGANYGFFVDTFPAYDVSVLENTFRTCLIGVVFNGGGTNLQRGGKIKWNFIYTRDSCIELNSASGFTVEENHLLVDPLGLGAGANQIVHNNQADAVNNIYRNNRVDPLLSAASFLTPATLQGNRYLDGSPIALMLDNVTPYNGTKINRVARADASTLGANQSIADGATGAGAIFDFSLINFDPGSLANATTNRFTVPATGNVIGHFHVTFATVTSAGTAQVEIRKNGTLVGLTVIPLPVALTGYQVEIMDRSAANDYYTASVLNSTGAALTIDRTYTNSYFSLEFFPDP